MPVIRAVVLISCVKTKRETRAKAKDLYESTLFRTQRAYAEHFADRWFILSAKHGLLDPEKKIDPYEETLKGASTRQKRDWSQRVFVELQKQTSAQDVITITAGEDYCRYLVPLLVERGNIVNRPVKGLAMGYIPGRLRELVASASRKAPATAAPNILVRAENPYPARLDTAIAEPRSRQLDRFYSTLSRLQELTRGPFLLSDLKSPACPQRGVYFFFEPGEVRTGGRTPRVVRVGTHGLKVGSKSTLYGRLAQHRGSSSGSGNHRGSVFRMHVGKALINDGLYICPTWSKGSSAPREVVETEQELEQAVSRYIGGMQVLLLSIPDEPGPESARGFIERNAIGLLTGQEKPSRTWLGQSTNNPAIVRSFLWNVNHVDHKPDADFIERFERLVSEHAASWRA